MRRLLSSLALLLALAAPAQAVGITIINGGGTGGSFANGSNITNTNTVVSGATTADIPIGSLVYLGLGVRSTAFGYTGCADTAGNTYPTTAAKPAASGQRTEGVGAITTIDLPIGSTFTCTLSGTTTAAKTINVIAFAGVNSATPDAAGFPTTTAAGTTAASTAISIGPSGTWGCPGAINCNVQIATWGDTVTPSVTEALGWTTVGNITASSGNLHQAYQITSLTTSSTYAVTNATSGTWAGLLQGFDASTGGATGAGRALPLLGVTN